MSACPDRALLHRALNLGTLVSLALLCLPGTARGEEVPSSEEAPPAEEVMPGDEESSGQDPRPAEESRSRLFERTIEDTSQVVEVKLTATAEVDERLLEYLEETLRVVAAGEWQQRELWTWRATGELEGGAMEVAVALRALDPADSTVYAWLPPDGFDTVRPGVLRPRPGLAEGLSKAPKAALARPPIAPTARRVRGGPFDRLTGTILCQAQDGTTTMREALGFLRIEVAGRQTTTRADGTFDLLGSFADGTHELKVVYNSIVGSGSPQTRLQVMGDLHQPYSETVTVKSRGSGGGTLELGEIVLTSNDCELWRLGTVVLDDYHASVGASPPARGLRLKRWSAIWIGTPHTYYDYVVLTTDFPRSGSYAVERVRRGTLFHEFGHSIRHVADGDEFHWAWDNFRWAYARSHTGCEVFNTQYAFNEGWANYWRGAVLGAAVQCDPSMSSGYLDWNEDQIGDHLLALASTLCSELEGPGCARRKMVRVLETFPGEIHSLREFEVRYCRLFAAGNSNCRAKGVPARPAPPSCPPEYFDDGATCRLDNIRAKPSYGRGVGIIPTGCDAGEENDAGLCYPRCQSGYHGVGPVCWEDCPSGFRDDGAFCAKPAPYGRGAGYPWQFGDPLDLSGAKARCERDHGAGNCEQNGLIFYPKCRTGFHNVGCCICSPNCPSGMADIGVSCTKRSYGRGVGTIPTGCSAGMENDAGLCYTPCSSGFTGVGPVCWGQCDPGFHDHGATCYRPPNVIVKY